MILSHLLTVKESTVAQRIIGRYQCQRLLGHCAICLLPMHAPSHSLSVCTLSGFYLLGKLPPNSPAPPPPKKKKFASDSTYHTRIAFLCSIMSVLITQELNSQVIMCLSFCTSHGRGTCPLLHPPPTATLSMMASPPDFIS